MKNLKNRCQICDTPLTGHNSKNCGSKKCVSEINKIRYKEKRQKELMNRKCPCCGNIIPNKDDNFCSDVCVTNCEGMNKSEEVYIRKNKYNIVNLMKSAIQLPERSARILEIEDRLKRKYKKKHPFSLPASTILVEFGFTEDIKTMTGEIYFSQMLAGTSYKEVAFDMSRYRKLFDYGVFLGLIE